MNDKMDDGELQVKVEQIIELTGASRDDAVVALHDCDNDMAKAVDMILEGDNLIESEWRSTGKKKKPPKTTTSSSLNNTNDESKVNLNGKDSKAETGGETKSMNKSIDNKHEKSSSRLGRGGGPPRLQKAAALAANRSARKSKDFNNKNVEKTENEETPNSTIISGSTFHPPSRRGDSRRGRGRGTGRGGNTRGGFSGSGSARGSRTFQNRGLHNNDGFPNSIDTWTNSTAEQTSTRSTAANDCNTMTVGNWSDIVANEDWSEEDWDSSVCCK